MHLDELRLRDLLEGLRGGGTLTFAGQRTLLLDATALGLLRAQLIELLGGTAARGILTRFGYAHGWRTAEAMRDALPWDDMREWRRAGGVLHRLQGLVDYRPTKKTDARNKAEARWYRSYEAQQHKLHIGPSEEAVCWTLTGFASGYMSFAFDDDIFCIETRCEGKSDPFCHMIGRRRQDWGTQIEEIERWYDKDSLDNALGVLGERLLAEERRWVARRRDQDVMVDGVGHEVIAQSASMQKAVDLALRIALVDTHAVVTGEPGTGKSCLARMIHEHSARANRPCLIVHGASLPEQMIQTELFGHARGAYDLALRDQGGVFEAAEGGTVVLTEIEGLSLETQALLARTLRESAVRRMGESKLRSFDARVIATMAHDPEEWIREGHLLRELYDVLRGVEIPVAPLRERQDDILPLARLHLARYRTEFELDGPDRIDRRAQRILTNYAWPGNVRELENTIKRAVLLAEGEQIGVVDLNEDLVEHAVGVRKPTGDASDRPIQPLEEVEREHILHVLEAVEGNRSEAARRLEIAPATLYRKLKKYGA